MRLLAQGADVGAVEVPMPRLMAGEAELLLLRPHVVVVVVVAEGQVMVMEVVVVVM